MVLYTDAKIQIAGDGSTPVILSDGLIIDERIVLRQYVKDYKQRIGYVDIKFVVFLCQDLKVELSDDSLDIDLFYYIKR